MKPVLSQVTPPDRLVRRLSGDLGKRSTEDMPQDLPVALRSTQPSIVLSTGRFERPTSQRVVLAKWVLSGQAMIGLHGQRLTFGPGDVALHLPSNPHAFWVLAERTQMCWFTVDGALAEQFVMGLGLRPGVHHYGPPPVDRIQELTDALGDHTIQGRRHSSLLAIGLLYEIANRVRAGGETIPSVIKLAQQLIHREFSRPELSTADLAARLNYHRGALSRLFHATTGVTLIDYLTQVRLQEARLLLMQTNDKVMNVAHKCGFRSAVYFSRWIRKHTGTTPEALRHAALT